MQQRAGRQQAAMPIPLPSAKLAEVCAPLPIVRQLLAENQAASSTASVSVNFRRTAWNADPPPVPKFLATNLKGHGDRHSAYSNV